MASSTLAAQSAFGAFKPLNNVRISIEVREDLTMASFAAANGKAAAVRDAIQNAYGAELLETPMHVQGKDVTFLWYGPDQWMAIAARGQSCRDLESELKALLAGLASVVDQSDGRAVVRLSGPRARDVLAKGVPVDLHPRAFKTNGVAITHASHIGILLWQVDDVPTFDIAMFRSYADGFLHWLRASAAEFNVA